jgi:Protein of unknown function (DUF1838)
MLNIGRRDTFGLLGGLLGAGTLVAGAGDAAARGAARARKLDWSNPDDRFRAYLKMRGALDEQLVISYISGSYFGVVGAEVTPLWDVIGVTFARYRRRADGSYDGVTGEIAHFLDPVTGEAPGAFLNPYTGKTVTDPRTNLPPSRIVLTPSLHMEVPRMPPGATMEHDIRAPEVRGDDVWFTELTRVAMQIPGGATPFRYNEVITMHARVADLENPALSRVPCEASFTNIVGWRPWMEMGDHPGHLTAVGKGKFGVTMDLLPERWTRATQAKWPQVLESPGALLDPLWKTLAG